MPSEPTRVETRGCPGRRAFRSTIAILGAAIAAGPVAAAAQTRFDYPVNRANYAHYTTPVECLAATQRVRDSVAWGQRHDTLAYAPEAAEPPAVVETARRCGARFDIATVEQDGLAALYRLMLVGGQDETAAEVLARHLELLGSRQLAESAAVLGDAATFALDTRPARPELAERIAHTMDSAFLGIDSGAVVGARVVTYSTMSMYAQAAMDTSLLRRASAGYLAALTSYPDSVVRGIAQKFFGAAQLPKSFGYPLQFLPVLRDSGAARYVARVRHTPPLGGVPAWLGSPAQPVTGDFWFRRGGDAALHPAWGKPALIVFNLRHDCSMHDCSASYAVLRRLGHRFGDALDIVMVAQTQGYFRKRPPQSPSNEAEATRHLFLDNLGLPGALAVETTPSIKRPPPDRRMRFELTPDQQSYGLARLGPAQFPLDQYYAPWTPAAFVVDPGGTVVFYKAITPKDERALTAVLDALLSDRSREADQ